MAWKINKKNKGLFPADLTGNASTFFFQQPTLTTAVAGQTFLPLLGIPTAFDGSIFSAPFPF